MHDEQQHVSKGK